MIWKILTGLFAAIALFALLFWLVPDLRMWNKKQDKANQALTDTLWAERAKSSALAREQAKLAARLERINRDYERSIDRLDYIEPTVKVEVAGLSTLAQRQSNLENLLADKLISVADTAKRTSVVSYNEPINQAITIKLRLADSLKYQLKFRNLAYSALNDAYQQRGDSMAKAKAFTAKGKQIAEQKGWFTGRNRRLREHAKKPPL